MENLSIATMPIKPRKKPCIGMCIAPIIKEILANEMNANELLCLNTLHSYENINELLDGSLEYFNKRHLDLSNIFIDSDHKEHLMEMVEKLYYNKILIIKKAIYIDAIVGKWI